MAFKKQGVSEKAWHFLSTVFMHSSSIAIHDFSRLHFWSSSTTSRQFFTVGGLRGGGGGCDAAAGVTRAQRPWAPAAVLRCPLHAPRQHRGLQGDAQVDVEDRVLRAPEALVEGEQREGHQHCGHHQAPLREHPAALGLGRAAVGAVSLHACCTIRVHSGGGGECVWRRALF